MHSGIVVSPIRSIVHAIPSRSLGSTRETSSNLQYNDEWEKLLKRNGISFMGVYDKMVWPKLRDTEEMTQEKIEEKAQ